jgi:hypothetical protein
MANPPKPPPKTETESQPNKWHIWIPTILVLVGWAYLHFSDYFELRVDKRVDLKLQESINKIDIKVQTTNDKLEKLGKDVGAVEAQLTLLIKVVMQPKTAVNAKQTSEILNTAKKSGTRFDPKLITIAGQEFISAGVSSSDPDIWKTALAFLNYRSTENTVGAATTDKFTPADKKKRYEWQGIFPVNSKNANFIFAHGKAVSAEKAAVFEPKEKHLNIGKTVGSEFILLGGSTGFPGGWKLDGYRMKNVIFKDTEITYEGGPVDMQNVYFVNCTFNVAKRPNGKNFASTVLASAPATTFHAGG